MIENATLFNEDCIKIMREMVENYDELKID